MATMSTEQALSTGDLRSNAQDYKRDATRKHKWALGATDGQGRAAGKPRPQRPSETHYNFSRRVRGAAIASLQNGAKLSRRTDIADFNTASDASEPTSDDGLGLPSPIAEPSPVYSFDAKRSPSHGSQILNAALAKAVEKFEERETTRLVKDEYSVLDAEGEVVEPSPLKKGKGKARNKASADHGVGAAFVPDADEDYEFV